MWAKPWPSQAQLLLSVHPDWILITTFKLLCVRGDAKLLGLWGGTTTKILLWLGATILLLLLLGRGVISAFSMECPGFLTALSAVLGSKWGVKPILFFQRTEKSWLCCPAHDGPGLPSQGSKPDPPACVTKYRQRQQSSARVTWAWHALPCVLRRWLGTRSLEWEGEKNN